MKLFEKVKNNSNKLSNIIIAITNPNIFYKTFINVYYFFHTSPILIVAFY